MSGKSIFSAVCLAACLLAACSDYEDSQKFTALATTEHAQINGTADRSRTHRAVVAIGSDMNGVSCTGTLVHPRWVVTAAHCVTEADGFGYKLSAPDWIGIGSTDESLTKYKVSSVYYNDSYGERILDDAYSTIDADIALIRLKKAVPASVAAPIPLLPGWLSLSSGDMPVKMEFSGYGFNEKASVGTKLKFSTNIEQYCGGKGDSKKGCKAGYIQIGHNYDIWGMDECRYGVSGAVCHPAAPYIDAYAGFCCCGERQYILMPYGSFKYNQKAGGPCQGDSGGPAFVTLGGVEYLAGVTSYGDPACAGYGISTATQNFNSWIKGYAPEVFDGYREVCDNGYDEDGDGKIDCADPDCNADPACGTPVEICDNGTDDDGNGLSDCADPACKFNSACLPGRVEICGNGRDDDGNGLSDCADPACKSHSSCLPVRVEICGNGRDDDGNGLSDCADPACINTPACLSQRTEICDNGRDDDGNGLSDCADPACINTPACLSQRTEICDNGADDDGDRLIDCADPDCYGHSACIASDSDGEICDNGVDDDGDGQSDCDDSDCQGAPACQVVKKSASDSCSAVPLGGGSRAPLAIFALFAAAWLRLRRRVHN